MPSPWEEAASNAKTAHQLNWLVRGSWLGWLGAVTVAGISFIEKRDVLGAALSSQSGALIIAATGWLLAANLISLSERRNTARLEAGLDSEAITLAAELYSARQLTETIAADLGEDADLKAAIERRRVG